MELVKPGRGGLNISWRTDVTSKQEKYIVVYTRNDTGKSVNIETREKFAELRDLYPGAEYRIQVLAVSHGLQSEPHTTHTAVLPNPAHNLSVAAVRDNTVTLRWLPPRNSRFTEYQVPRPSPVPPSTVLCRCATGRWAAPAGASPAPSPATSPSSCWPTCRQVSHPTQLHSDVLSFQVCQLS